MSFLARYIIESQVLIKRYTDFQESRLEHPRKLRTFADEYSTVRVSAAFFSMSDSSQKLSTAPWHEMKNSFLYHRASVRKAY